METTAQYLANKTGVNIDTIRELLALSRKYSTMLNTPSRARDGIHRAYDKIVNTRCGGLDPLE